MSEVDLIPELRAAVHVEPVPGAQLVHLAAAGALVLTPHEARAVARDLERAAARAARTARPRARGRATAAP